MSRRARIVLADDHPIVMEGLRNLIAAQPDLDLVGEATSGLKALKLIQQEIPDIAVIDISMPEMNGIVLSRKLSTELPTVRVIILTLHEERAFLKQAMATGVRGYILKRSAAENLIQAIRAVWANGLYVDPAIAARMFDERAQQPGGNKPVDASSALTSREAEVLRCCALGFTNKEIAAQFDVSAKTIETQKARGSIKLGIKTRAELVRYASAQGWLDDIL